jgi:beta-lactamase regulating signal transducer with metallopeptidase domain/thiol-disulfide isomerase/thioredoxin/protocatechuate 3,4-dioxygenase beta subunit
MITAAQIENSLDGFAGLTPIFADACVKGTVVLGITWLVTSRMRRWSAATRHAVWLAGLVSLLMLPLMGRALPAWRVLPASWDVDQALTRPLSGEAQPHAATPTVSSPVDVPQPAEMLTTDPPLATMRLPQAPADWESPARADRAARPFGTSNLTPAVQGGFSRVAPAPTLPASDSAIRSVSPWVWIGLTWLAGTALLSMRLLLGLACVLWASWRLPACGDEDWQGRLRGACAELGIRRRVRLVQGGGRAMPMTWGILRPHLLVPAEACNWSPQRRRVVLLHELAHVKRQDCLTQLVAEITCAAYWFNPIAWLASRRMQAEAERACDDLVLARGSRPAEYAEHLLQVAAGQHQGYLAAAAAAAIPMARPSRLEGRLLAILDGKRSRRAATLGAALLAMALLAGVAVPVAMLRAANRPADSLPSAGRTLASQPARSEPAGEVSAAMDEIAHLEQRVELIRQQLAQGKASESELNDAKLALSEAKLRQAVLAGDPASVSRALDEIYQERRQMLESVQERQHIGKASDRDVLQADLALQEARLRQAMWRNRPQEALGTIEAIVRNQQQYAESVRELQRAGKAAGDEVTAALTRLAEWQDLGRKQALAVELQQKIDRLAAGPRTGQTQTELADCRNKLAAGRRQVYTIAAVLMPNASEVKAASLTDLRTGGHSPGSQTSGSSATAPAAAQATQPATQPVAASAVSESQPAAQTPADEGITVTGIVTDELGHPRANVQFGVRFPSGLWRGPASDADGRFTLKGVTPDKGQWIAYSQATRRMALFTLPADAASKPIQVKLNLWEGELEGRVVDANGHGVPKVKVRLGVRTQDGQRYLSDVFQSDADGYYDHDGVTPVGEGLTIEARLESRAGEEDAWQCRTVLKAGQLDAAMPDLVNRDVEAKPGPAPASPRVGFGGRVMDEQGKPIAGAVVEIYYSLPGQSRGVWERRTATGADGRWMRHLPADMKETFMRLYHAQYVSGEQLSLPATDRMRDGSAVFVMKKGMRISGTVRSRDGGSIEDALVLANPNTATTGGLGEPIDDGTMVRTGADGTFVGEGAPPGRRGLTVYARGYGPRVVDVDVRPDMPPVDVVLDPGTSIHGQVVNPEGEPVEAARVTCTDWTVGGERRAIPRETQADSEGWFELADMPTQGTFQLYYSKKGSEYIYTSSKELTWRKEPYRLTLYRPTVIHGVVVDDESGKPIQQFQVAECTRFRDDQTPSIRESKTVTAADGKFRAALDGWIVSAEGPSLAARVQAPGYLPAETEYVPIGGKIEPVTLRLVKARPIRGIVRGTDGKPFAGAMVYWVGPGRLAFIQNGEINESIIAAPDATGKTDAKGIFELPASKDAGIILVLDKAGYAVRESSDHDPDDPFRLIAWARIEGVLKASEKGQAGMPVCFTPVESRSFNDKHPQVYFQGTQVTHTDGTFIFENVPSIPLKVGRPGSGFISHVVKLTPAAGKTTRLEIGGGGAAVAGRIVKPDGLNMDTFTDEYGLGKHYTRVIAYPAEAAGVTLDQRTVYAAVLQPDGHFQIYGLPAGSYVLDVGVHPPPQAGTCGVPVAMATGKVSFEITRTGQEEVSLPPIRLVLNRGPQPGQVAELAGTTLSGERFDLTQFRGKVVLLDIWASWCAPCRSETPRLKQLWEKYGTGGKVAFVGINCDWQPEQGRKYVAEQSLSWPQVATGQWGEDNAVLSSLGINAIPSFWVIGPDGKVLARDVPAESLGQQLEEALGRDAASR